MKNINYIKHLDGLRGIAIIFVILYHVNPKTFSGGYIGVDVFFVLSGYLITKKLLSTEKISVKEFYVNRFKRLYPATLFVILLSTIVVLFIFTPSNLKDYLQSVVSTIFFSSNILFYTENSYFHTDALLKPLLHTWSLGIEEQFYIFYPLFILKFKKRKNLALLFLTLFSLTLSITTLPELAKANYFLPIFRFWEIGFGCLVFTFYNKLSPILRQKISLQYLSVITLFVCLFVFNADTSFPGINALIVVIATCLLILLDNPDSLLYKLLTLQYLINIGKLSFSLYLVHQPIFAVYKYLFGKNLNLLSLILLIISIFYLSKFIYTNIENKYRAKQFMRKDKILMSFLTSVLLLVGLYGQLNNGYENRIDRFQLSSVEYSGDMSQTGMGSISNGNNQVILYGDSHAQQILKSISQKYTVNFSIVPGCLSFETFTSSSSSNINQECLSQFDEYKKTQLESTKYTVFSFSWGYIKNTDQLTYLLDAINKFGKANPQNIFILVGPTPESNYEGGFLRCKLNPFTSCQNQYPIYFSKNNEINNIFENYNFEKNIETVNLFNLFCDGNFCYEVEKGNLIYFDGSHTTNYSSDKIAQEIFKIIEN